MYVFAKIDLFTASTWYFVFHITLTVSEQHNCVQCLEETCRTQLYVYANVPLT